MRILQVIGIVLVTILTSLYFFPFEFTFLPGINTKMAMAGFGLVLLAFQLAKQQESLINRDIFQLSLWAGLVSLVGWISITYNDTPDTAYATYIVSMWVWLSAAYVVTFCMRKIHGQLSVSLIVRYLMVVCIAQCILALLIDAYPAFKHTIDLYVQQGQEFLNKSNVRRLYGIGASLDVAGSRFAAVLTLIAFSTTTIEKTKLRKWMPWYLIAFFVIGIVGNMIARTTTVGLVLALGYWVYALKIYQFRIENAHKWLWRWGLFLLLLTVGVTTYLYVTIPTVTKHLQFAFEGFFSLAEKGVWEVSSNERLKNMFVFPETLKTWIVGDGYFSNPLDVDPYFIGKEIGGYYMGTDVGYLRFIYYFGIFGLMGMCMVLYKAGSFCMRKLAHCKGLFILLLLTNYIVWLKVSTDIFLVFALFLMIREDEEKAYERQIALRV